MLVRKNQLTYSLIHISCFKTEEFEVNLNCPERNRGTNILKIQDIPGVIKTEERFHGYCFPVKVDPRFEADEPDIDHYTAQVFQEDGVLLKEPATDYTLLHCRDALQVEAKRSKNMLDAMDNYRHEYSNNEEGRKWKYKFAKFPPGTVLSAKAMSEHAGDEESLPFRSVVLSTAHKTLGTITETWYFFKVARIDLQSSKRGRVEKKTKKSKAAIQREQQILEAAEEAAEEAALDEARAAAREARGTANPDAVMS